MLAVCVCVQHLLCVHLTPCDNGRIQACNHVPHGYLLCDCVSCFCRESLCLSWCQSDTDVVMLLVILLCHSENGSVYLGWEPCFGGQSCVWHFTRKHGLCVRQVLFCSHGWSQSHILPASDSEVLRLEVCTFPGLNLLLQFLFINTYFYQCYGQMDTKNKIKFTF